MRRDANYRSEKTAAVVSNWMSEAEEAASQEAGVATLLAVREVANMARALVTWVHEPVRAGGFACHRVGTGCGAIRIRREDADCDLVGCCVDGHGQTPETIRPHVTNLKTPNANPVAVEGPES